MAARDFFGFVGECIEPQYRVDQVIGEGGFSVVYRGHHLGLDEPVAIKCLKMPAGLTPGMVDAVLERFQAESRIMYRLSQGNLNIVRSISSGTGTSKVTGALVPYMVLEWLDGVSLFQDLKERRLRKMIGRNLQDTIRLLDPAAMALDYAHAQGVVHRDLKPGNLFLADTRDGIRSKVLDFGLAKVLSDDGIGLGPAQHTMSQGIFCSLSYGAPEQFDPKRGPVGPWTDVYSFAFVILEVLSDKKIRPAETMVDAARKAFDEKADLSASALGIELPEKIEDLLFRAVKVDKTQRPPDMHALWGQIKRVVKEEGIKVRVPATYNGPESAPSMVTQMGPGSPGFSMPNAAGERARNAMMGSPLGDDAAPAPRPAAGAPATPPPPPPPAHVQVILNDLESSPDLGGIPLTTRRQSSRPPPAPGAANGPHEPTVPVGSFNTAGPASIKIPESTPLGAGTLAAPAGAVNDALRAAGSLAPVPASTLGSRSLTDSLNAPQPPAKKNVMLVAIVLTVVVVIALFCLARFGTSTPGQ